MAAVGDIVAHTGIDDSKWEAGIIRMQNSTKRLGGEIKSNLGSSVGQVGFMIQDFSSVLAMGGKNALGRAMMSTMNNVQMLGSAFGPWGMAITSVGGGIASVLIPHLMQGTEETDKFTESIKTQTKELEANSKAIADRTNFGRSLDRMTTRREAMSTAGDLGSDLEVLQKERNAYQKLATEIVKEGLNTGKLESSSGVNPATGLPEDWAKANIATQIRFLTAGERHGLWGSTPIPGGAEAKAELDEIGKKLIEFDNRISETGLRRGAAEARARELAAVEKGQSQLNRQMEIYADQLKAAEKALEASRSPLDIAQDKLAELDSLVRGGFLSPEQGLKAATKLQKDAAEDIRAEAKKNAPNRQVSGVEGRTTEGIAAVQGAIRQSMGQQQGKEQVDLLKQSVDLFKKMVAELQKANRTPPRSEGI